MAMVRLVETFEGMAELLHDVADSGCGKVVAPQQDAAI